MPTPSDRDPIDVLIAAVLAAEAGPTPEDLDNAPLLSGWWLRPLVGLGGLDLLVAEGEVTGHPAIAEPWVTTSIVLAFDPDKKWMRTRSRWYRLGAPASPEHVATIKQAAQQYFAALRARVLKNRAKPS